MREPVGNPSPETILHRVPELRINIDSGNNVEILIRGEVLTCGTHGLAVLDAFSQPRSIAQVLEILNKRITGALDWTDLIATIIQLYRAGVLRDENQIQPALRSSYFGFDAAPVHVAMLNDKVRTSAFLSAIREVVRPGDVVVEIGTGTGVLAIGAALAGAKHVYAIESTSIGKLAKAVFDANQLSDRITLIEGWSTQISLPEPADVLVSEIIGDSPFGEKLLEFTLDARKRFLKPQARMIPNIVQVYGMPVRIPWKKKLKHLFTQQSIRKWKSWYGIDFNPLLNAARSVHHRFYIRPGVARKWTFLADPVLLAETDLKTFQQWTFRNSITVPVASAGRLDGMIVYFETELSPSWRLSTDPAKAEQNCHWHSGVWAFPEPLYLKSGDRFEVIYERDAGQTSLSARRIE